MGADGAANIIFRRQINAAAEPDKEKVRRELVAEYTEQLMNPFVAARRGHVDDVIDPADTRRVLIKSLDMLRTKRARQPLRKHGNEPL
jgi:acetyl-CoA carboxylase carboxyltransferase component